MNLKTIVNVTVGVLAVVVLIKTAWLWPLVPVGLLLLAVANLVG